MRVKRILVVAFAILFCIQLFGCASAKVAAPTGSFASRYQSVSSTKVGCLPDEITITDLDMHGAFDRTRDWYATCNGQTYFCSGINNGSGGTTDVSCMKRSSNNNAAKTTTAATATTTTPTVSTETKAVAPTAKQAKQPSKTKK